MHLHKRNSKFVLRARIDFFLPLNEVIQNKYSLLLSGLIGDLFDVTFVLTS